MPSLEEVAVELGVRAAWVVRNEGELGVRGTGGGQGDPTQSMGHEEGLQTTKKSITRVYSTGKERINLILLSRYPLLSPWKCSLQAGRTHNTHKKNTKTQIHYTKGKTSLIYKASIPQGKE